MPLTSNLRQPVFKFDGETSPTPFPASVRESDIFRTVHAEKHLFGQ